MKRLFAFLLFAALLPLSFVSCGSEDNSVSGGSNIPTMGDISVTEDSSALSEEPDRSISVVVLGDSIARGYGLENVQSQRFSSLLAESLKNVYAEVEVANYGVDGMTGAELLESLKSSPAAELTDCDSVIISIGGNNILGRLQSFDTILSALSDIDPNAFSDYFKYLMETDAAKKDKLSYACGIIGDAFKAVNAAFSSETFENIIIEAGKDLAEEIPAIVSEIKKINPAAKIYIQTIYNPYNGVNVVLQDIGEKLDLSSPGKRAVTTLNAPIEALAKTNGYTVVPVFEEFEKSDKTLLNAGFELAKAKFSVDPHPNARGHELMAEIYFKLLTEE